MPTARRVRSLRGWTLVLLLAAGGCPDSGGDGCPDEFKAGQECEVEGQVCRATGSQCEDTTCTCANELGGFYWDCSDVPYCSCTCPCGKIAINTCESLGCVRKATDPCPAKSEAVCNVVCLDAGVPDAGPDQGGPDAGPDAAVDAGPPDSQPVDTAPADVAPADSLLPDAPLPDAPLPDAPLPDAPLPDVAAPDIPPAADAPLPDATKG